MPTPRLALTPDVSHGPLDGAWWPRCDALELELPSLVGSLEPDPDTTVRVTVDPAEWPDTPCTVMAPGRVTAVEPADPENPLTGARMLALAETDRLGGTTGEAE
ncbi:DUF5994 family protein [Streptomyces sp. NPDC001135]